MSKNLSRLFLFHAFITVGAGVVLLAAPGLIPGMVGIHLEPDAYLGCYFIAAAELGFAALSWQAARLTDAPALRAIATACIVFHAVSGLAEVYAVMRGVNPMLLANFAARVVIVALLARLAPRGPVANADGRAL